MDQWTKTTQHAYVMYYYHYHTYSMKYLLPSGVAAASHPGGSGICSKLGRSSSISPRLGYLLCPGCRLGWGIPPISAGQEPPRKCVGAEKLGLLWGSMGGCWSPCCEPSMLPSGLWEPRMRAVGLKNDSGRVLLCQLDWLPPFWLMFLREFSKRISSSCVESLLWWTTWLGPVCWVTTSSADILFVFQLSNDLRWLCPFFSKYSLTV